MSQSIGNIVFGSSLKDFDRFFVGFDDQFSRIAKMHDDLTKSVPNYPPYNIRKTGDATYVIEIAVAGFGQGDIDIEIKDNVLTVQGKVKADEEGKKDFLFKGIANRSFTRTFALDDHVEVKDAELENGMLTVFLERLIPEHKKPRKIAIAGKSSPQMLVE